MNIQQIQLAAQTISNNLIKQPDKTWKIKSTMPKKWHDLIENLDGTEDDSPDLIFAREAISLAITALIKGKPYQLKIPLKSNLTFEQKQQWLETTINSNQYLRMTRFNQGILTEKLTIAIQYYQDEIATKLYQKLAEQYYQIARYLGDKSVEEIDAEYLTNCIIFCTIAADSVDQVETITTINPLNKQWQKKDSVLNWDKEYFDLSIFEGDLLIDWQNKYYYRSYQQWHPLDPLPLP